MPRISAFYGIVVAMYFDEHPPPHFHARYGEHSAQIAIATGEVINGFLPRRAIRWSESGPIFIAPNWGAIGSEHEWSSRSLRLTHCHECAV